MRRTRDWHPFGLLGKALALCLAVLATLGPLPPRGAQATGPIVANATTWVTQGQGVSSVARDPATGIVYIGGLLFYVGPFTGSGAPVDMATGEPESGFPKVNGGMVRAVAADGAGGWYIGGDFTQVGGLARNRVAHILADKSVDPAWDPNAGYRVHTLAVSGGTVYAGGRFTSIGGQARNNIAALDAATGTATAWNPNANNAVRALAVSGSTVYAGGDFSSIGGQARTFIAALDAGTGSATAWNPGTSGGVVYALAVSGSTVYAGGYFSGIGGQARMTIAALDAATGSATDWDPNPSGDGTVWPAVRALAVSGGTVYAGGDFTGIGGQPRNYLAALDAVTGAATPWDPNASNRWNTPPSVQALAVSGSNVYAGGNFTTIGGQPRNYLAALDAATGAATPWEANADQIVFALAVSGGKVFAGGQFISIGGALRNYLAAVDPATGDVTPWNPNPDGGAAILAVSGGTVYVGGSFTSIGGQPRNRLAALDASTANATPWDPNPNGGVGVLTVSGDTLYVGGSFTSIGGQPRNRIASLDAATGSATPWDPNADSYVRTLSVSGNTVYAGGQFTSIGGQPRNRIAALDAATGSATPWDPNPSLSDPDLGVNTLAVSGSTVYVGGDFTSIGGQPRNSIAALDAATGAATAWDPNASGSMYAGGNVRALAVSGGTVYAGGSFTSIGGQERNGMAALDAATGSATAWDPNATWNSNSAISCTARCGFTVRALGLSGDSIYAVGDFWEMAGWGSWWGYLAAIPNQPPTMGDTPDQSVPEDGRLGPMGVTVDDPEAGPNPLTLTAASSNPSLVLTGNVVFGGSGLTRTMTITPGPNQYGTAAITLTVSDGFLTASDSFTLTVTPVNDPPTLDSVADRTINQDTGEQTVGLSGISPGPVNESGQAVTVSASSSNPGLIPNPAVGYTNPASAGSLSFTPVAGANGTATITVTVRDNGGTANGGVDTIARTFSVKVNGRPVAVDDLIATLEDTPLGISVLANDSDPDADGLSVVSVGVALSGTAAISGTTALVYTPGTNFNGTDSFVYTASDGALTATARVTVAVSPVNDAPTLDAVPHLGVNEDAGEQTVALAGISPGPANEAGQTLTVTATSSNLALIANPTVSYASPGATGSLRFTPAANAHGAGTVTVTVRDDGGTGSGGADTIVRTFRVTVNPVNDPPVAADDLFTVPANSSDNVLNVLANDVDADGNPLTVSAVGIPANGTAAIGAGGANVLYTPPPNFGGTSVFTYTATDGAATSSATVTVTVNRPPVAASDLVTVTANTANNFVNVLANDSDPDGNPIVVSTVSQGANGGVTLGPGGTHVLYTPRPCFAGPDLFTYTISDGMATATASVSVTVDAVAVNDLFTVPANSAGNVLDVLANDRFPGGGPVTITAVTQPLSGTVGIGGGGANVLYTPNVGFAGGSPSPTFTYTATNGLSTAMACVDVRVNRPPVAVDDAASTLEDSPVAINVLANDIDLDGDSLSLVTVGPPVSGTAAITGTTIVVYTPGLNFYGTDSFTYTTNDGALTATARVTVAVSPLNDPPALDVPVDQAINEDAGEQTVALYGTSGPSNESGQALTVTATSSNPGVIPNPTVGYTGPAGALRFTPVANAHGTVTITVTVRDDGGTANDGMDTITRTFTVTVNPVNDPPVAADDTAVTQQDTPVVITVLANDRDVDGDALGVSRAGRPVNGSATTDGTTVTYTPALMFTGTDVFTYTVSDGSLTATGRVTVTVEPLATVGLSPIEGVVISPTITLTGTGGLGVTLAFPPGAVGQAVTVTLTVTDTGTVGPTMRALGRAFVIEARDEAGYFVTTFARPFTITVRYKQEDVAGMDENGLRLFYWDSPGGAWVALPTIVDAAANTLTASLDRTAKIAAMGQTGWRSFLPMLARGYGGAW